MLFRFSFWGQKYRNKINYVPNPKFFWIEF